MRPLFNVPGIGSYALIMGSISGYPIGAKIVADLKSQNLCTDVESERLLSFTNNSGPLFIVGTIGCGMFYDVRTGMLLLLTHLLASISVGFIFRWWKSRNPTPSIKAYSNSISNHKYINEDSEIANLSNLGEILSKSIMDAISTVTMIGGFIILFSVVISILQNSQILYALSSLLEPIFTLLRISGEYSSRSYNRSD